MSQNQLPKSKVKNKNGSFWFEYHNGSHGKLLKKFKGSVADLNVEIKNILLEYISKNKNSSYIKTRKKVYLTAIENEDVAEFCNQKNLSRPELAELVKNEFIHRYK